MSAAENGQTDIINRFDLDKIKIEPRILNSQIKVNLKTSFFEKFEFPFLVCPMGTRLNLKKTEKDRLT